MAVTAPGLEAVTASELRALGLTPGPVEPGAVPFEASPTGLWQANLELRTASRILVPIAEFPARAFYELERKAKRIPWAAFAPAGGRARFRVTSRKSKLYHLDGIGERLGRSLLEQTGVPADAVQSDDDEGVDAQLFVVRVVRDVFTISADSSGELLHRRGYRLATAKAPLRETLAAAILLAAGYDGSEALLDPFTGSGTIPIEAALIARRMAPGLTRRFAFERWPGFDAAGWATTKALAAGRALSTAPAPIRGSDRDEGAVEAARSNAARAGVAADTVFATEAFSAAVLPALSGLVATNPPYGIRVGEDVRDLYARLGGLLGRAWAGWRLAMLAARETHTSQLGLTLTTAWESSNGGIPIRLVTAAASPRG